MRKHRLHTLASRRGECGINAKDPCSSSGACDHDLVAWRRWSRERSQGSTFVCGWAAKGVHHRQGARRHRKNFRYSEDLSNQRFLTAGERFRAVAMATWWMVACGPHDGKG